jgi:hypothetical protein
VLNILYLVNSINECVDPTCRWSEQSTCSSISRDCTCDLDEYSVLVLLLSSLTSAAMFAFKLSTLEVIKLSLDMDHVLEQQHADLKTDLQASLSPRDFRKVSQVLSEHAPRKFSILSHRQGPAAVVPEGSPKVRSEPVGAAFDAHASSICLILSYKCPSSQVESDDPADSDEPVLHSVVPIAAASAVGDEARLSDVDAEDEIVTR